MREKEQLIEHLKAGGKAVLNADDPLCLQMADYTEASRLCYVTMNPGHALVKRHIQAGGQAWVLEQGSAQVQLYALP